MKSMAQEFYDANLRLTKLVCCKDREMRSTGGTRKGRPILHEHVCDICGRKEWARVVYPVLDEETAKPETP